MFDQAHGRPGARERTQRTPLQQTATRSGSAAQEQLQQEQQEQEAVRPPAQDTTTSQEVDGREQQVFSRGGRQDNPNQSETLEDPDLELQGAAYFSLLEIAERFRNDFQIVRETIRQDFRCVRNLFGHVLSLPLTHAVEFVADDSANFSVGEQGAEDGGPGESESTAISRGPAAEPQSQSYSVAELRSPYVALGLTAGVLTSSGGHVHDSQERHDGGRFGLGIEVAGGFHEEEELSSSTGACAACDPHFGLGLSADTTTTIEDRDQGIQNSSAGTSFQPDKTTRTRAAEVFQRKHQVTHQFENQNKAERTEKQVLPAAPSDPAASTIVAVQHQEDFARVFSERLRTLESDCRLLAIHQEIHKRWLDQAWVQREAEAYQRGASRFRSETQMRATALVDAVLVTIRECPFPKVCHVAGAPRNKNKGNKSGCEDADESSDPLKQVTSALKYVLVLSDAMKAITDEMLTTIAIEDLMLLVDALSFLLEYGTGLEEMHAYLQLKKTCDRLTLLEEGEDVLRTQDQDDEQMKNYYTSSSSSGSAKRNGTSTQLSAVNRTSNVSDMASARQQRDVVCEDIDVGAAILAEKEDDDDNSSTMGAASIMPPNQKYAGSASSHSVPAAEAVIPFLDQEAAIRQMALPRNKSVAIGSSQQASILRAEQSDPEGSQKVDQNYADAAAGSSSAPNNPHRSKRIEGRRQRDQARKDMELQIDLRDANKASRRQIERLLSFANARLWGSISSGQHVSTPADFESSRKKMLPTALDERTGIFPVQSLSRRNAGTEAASSVASIPAAPSTFEAGHLDAQGSAADMSSNSRPLGEDSETGGRAPEESSEMQSRAPREEKKEKASLLRRQRYDAFTGTSFPGARKMLVLDARNYQESEKLKLHLSTGGSCGSADGQQVRSSSLFNHEFPVVEIDEPVPVDEHSSLFFPSLSSQDQCREGPEAVNEQRPLQDQDLRRPEVGHRVINLDAEKTWRHLPGAQEGNSAFLARSRPPAAAPAPLDSRHGVFPDADMRDVSSPAAPLRPASPSSSLFANAASCSFSSSHLRLSSLERGAGSRSETSEVSCTSEVDGAPRHERQSSLERRELQQRGGGRMNSTSTAGENEEYRGELAGASTYFADRRPPTSGERLEAAASMTSYTGTISTGASSRNRQEGNRNRLNAEFVDGGTEQDHTVLHESEELRRRLFNDIFASAFVLDAASRAQMLRGSSRTDVDQGGRSVTAADEAPQGRRQLYAGEELRPASGTRNNDSEDAPDARLLASDEPLLRGQPSGPRTQLRPRVRTGRSCTCMNAYRHMLRALLSRLVSCTGSNASSATDNTRTRGNTAAPPASSHVVRGRHLRRLSTSSSRTSTWAVLDMEQLSPSDEDNDELSDADNFAAESRAHDHEEQEESPVVQSTGENIMAPPPVPTVVPTDDDLAPDRPPHPAYCVARNPKCNLLLHTECFEQYIRTTNRKRYVSVPPYVPTCFCAILFLECMPLPPTLVQVQCPGCCQWGPYDARMGARFPPAEKKTNVRSRWDQEAREQLQGRISSARRMPREGLRYFNLLGGDNS
ncbi:unnamed protein product [Amoebophrya sp. A120]|nr:unnamed protein product [Amoebophrya sp. A120]|eukprot:GSA120T00007547001.1